MNKKRLLIFSLVFNLLIFLSILINFLNFWSFDFNMLSFFSFEWNPYYDFFTMIIFSFFIILTVINLVLLKKVHPTICGDIKNFFKTPKKLAKLQIHLGVILLILTLIGIPLILHTFSSNALDGASYITESWMDSSKSIYSEDSNQNLPTASNNVKPIILPLYVSSVSNFITMANYTIYIIILLGIIIIILSLIMILQGLKNLNS